MASIDHVTGGINSKWGSRRRELKLESGHRSPRNQALAISAISKRINTSAISIGPLGEAEASKTLRHAYLSAKCASPLVEINHVKGRETAIAAAIVTENQAKRRGEITLSIGRVHARRSPSFK